ncbi:hypothetical protein [Actinomadura bangladeshensis]|uniref:hypothetical protein n=1 Tax=Actinomadura bangladeshensis TaxID=453573 RepID=UPI0019456832|nr:hypothetical protein [Actinomadura bangladeshensis]
MIGKGGHSDAYSRLQRSAPLKLEAEMAWVYLPPRTIGTEQVTSSAVLEPAYDLGGDVFDHSLIGGDLHITVLDSMRHDLLSGLTSTVAMASCRNVRRSSSGSLQEIVTTVDQNLASGTMTWINCGQPSPLLLRDQNLVLGALDRAPQLRDALRPGPLHRLHHPRHRRGRARARGAPAPGQQHHGLPGRPPHRRRHHPDVRMAPDPDLSRAARPGRGA